LAYFFLEKTYQNEVKNEVVLEACSDSNWCEDKVERLATYSST